MFIASTRLIEKPSLDKAMGENANPFYKTTEIKEPIGHIDRFISNQADEFEEYDLPTKKGRTYGLLK
ncbi:hypothetical protein [Olivibacter sp. XZL3]|uniref:hypothetical protein n=1 Tax=Olivibacter sp. XZL3 TaxID=1735116 RepID=UPI0010670F47|nr:hypothetical protein [Olivibacter sp. XZL3]